MIAADSRQLALGLQRYDEVYNQEFGNAYGAKFGFVTWCEEDADLVEEAFGLLHRAEIDMTLFFRSLTQIDPEAPDPAIFKEAFYRPEMLDLYANEINSWLAGWSERVLSDHESSALRVARMNAANPCYVLRNYLAQQAIDRAEKGDYAMIHELLEVLQHPYDEQPGRESFAAKRPEWARHKAGCSMLSCSS